MTTVGQATKVEYGRTEKERLRPSGVYMPVGDEEAGTDGQMAERLDDHVDRALRLGFIRKVYGILSLQLALTAAVSSLLTFVTPCREFVITRPSLLYVGFFASIGVLFALMAYKDRHPLNAKLLFAWTLIEAYTVGVICAAYTAAGQGALVVEALALTFAVFFALTVFTCQSKIDFSFLGAGLGACLWVLLLWGFVSMIFGNAAGGVYSLFGAVIFSGYIVFDTYLIIKKYGYDDAILASVTLYLDLVNLFLFILQLLSSRGDRN